MHRAGHSDTRVPLRGLVASGSGAVWQIDAGGGPQSHRFAEVGQSRAEARGRGQAWPEGLWGPCRFRVLVRGWEVGVGVGQGDQSAAQLLRACRSSLGTLAAVQVWRPRLEKGHAGPQRPRPQEPGCGGEPRSGCPARPHRQLGPSPRALTVGPDRGPAAQVLLRFSARFSDNGHANSLMHQPPIDVFLPCEGCLMPCHRARHLSGPGEGWLYFPRNSWQRCSVVCFVTRTCRH